MNPNLNFNFNTPGPAIKCTAPATHHSCIDFLGDNSQCTLKSNHITKTFVHSRKCIPSSNDDGAGARAMKRSGRGSEKGRERGRERESYRRRARVRERQGPERSPSRSCCTAYSRRKHSHRRLERLAKTPARPPRVRKARRYSRIFLASGRLRFRV